MRRLAAPIILLLCALLLGVVPPHVRAQEAEQTAQPNAATASFYAAQFLPAAGITIGVDTAITVVFNRPVVPLALSGDAVGDLPAPFTLTPEAPGEGEWINTSIYSFRPHFLAGGTQYTVTLRPDLAAADGTPLDAPQSWQFTTEPPRVVEVSPQGDQTVARDAAVTLHFNQPMDRASTEAAVTITAGDSAISGAFQWQDEDRTLVFTSDADYAYGAEIGVQLTNAARGANGGALADDAGFVFDIVPAPAIISSDPYDGQQDAQPYGGITIYFASPMNVETLRDRITVEPEPWREYDDYYSEYSNSYSLSFPTEPSTDYTVTIAPGMEDVYGTPIEDETVIRYTTAPYNPEISFQVPGEIGFYNAGAERTQLYVTTRNVSAVRLELSSLPMNRFIEAQASGYVDPTRLSTDIVPVRTWQIIPEADENVLRYDLLSLNANEDAPLPPGLYRLTADAREFTASNIPSSTLLVVGSAVLTLKDSPGELLVWATDANTGAPIPNAQLRVIDYPPPVYDDNGLQILADYTETRATTDADGVARFALPVQTQNYRNRLAILDDAEHFGIGSTQWSSGIEAYSFGVPVAYNTTPYTTYLYSDRPVYRPGQPVYVRGIARLGEVGDARFGRVVPTPDMPDPVMYVRLRDENNEIVYEDRLDLSPEGGFDFTYTLPPEIALGYYALYARVLDRDAEPPEDDYGYGADEPARLSFGVLEYRAPEFQVTLTPEQAEVAQGDTIRVALDARFFFGGVVNGASFNYNVVAAPFDFDYQGQGRYQFSDYDFDAGSSEYYAYDGGVVASGSGVLDADGQFMIDLPAALEDDSNSQTLTIEANVLDESGQTVSGRAEVIVHKGEFYIGVAPARYVAAAGIEAQVNLIAVDWQSQPLAQQAIDIEVVERRWSSVQEMDDLGRTTWTYEVEEIPVTSGSATTDADGRAIFAFTPPNGGVFKIKARAADDAGNTVISAATVWATGSDYIAWRQQNSARIDLVADKTDYTPGETAEILIASPFQGASEALITIEQGGVLRAERVTMENNSFIYRVPILADYAPTVYVSAVIVHGVDANNPVASFRMGLVRLNVSTEQQTLTIQIERAADPDGMGDTVSPGEQVTYTVRTTDAAGNPVAAEIGAALSDVATLTIAPPNSQDILDYFYGEAALGVSTSTALTINTDQTTQTILETIKGGGGGFGEGGIFDIREEFIDTPYWNARITTDASGTATFTVTLPDNLTTFRLDVRGVATQDSRLLVGSTTQDVISTRPLLIRPITPRFFTLGDQVTLAALVNNNTGEDLAVEVTLEGTGISFEAASQTVEIAAGQRARVTWLVTVEDTEAVDLTFYARALNPGDPTRSYQDASVPPLGQGDEATLPVYRAVPETIGTAGSITQAGSITEVVQLPDPTAQPFTDARLNVQLEPSLTAASLASAEVLSTWRYLSVESIASRTLANTRLYRIAGELRDQPALRETLRAEIEAAVSALRAAQNIDGGWGWAQRESSDRTTTAWALRALVEVGATLNLDVSDRVDAAVTFLRFSLESPTLTTEQWRLDRQAFMLYALAAAGQGEPSRVARLYEQRTRLSLWAEALLVQTLDLDAAAGAESAPAQRDVLVADLFSRVQTSAAGAFWQETPEDGRDFYNWNTDTRTTAIVIDTLSRIDPQNPILANAVRWLAAQRTAQAWETTQETAWALLGLTEFSLQTGDLQPTYAYSLALNGAVVVGQAVPRSATDVNEASYDLEQLNASEPNTLTLDRTDGTGSLYYTAYLTVDLDAAALEAQDSGILISRRYTRPGDNAPVTEARVGELLTATLTIIAPQDLHFVTVTDPIPAGTDAIDPALITSQQVGTDPSLTDVENPNPSWWAGYYFSDIEFRDEAVVMSASYLPAGTYEFTYTVRAGLEGVYGVLPATASEQYFPDVYGRSAGSLFTILPAAE